MSLIAADGQFVFPDNVFPEVPAPFPGLPMAPQEKLEKILSEYHQYVDTAMAGISQDSQDQVNKLFKWAREAVDFAETQPGVPVNVISTAMDIIHVVGSSEGSKFKGAAMYMIGLWHLFGLFGSKVSNTKSRELFMASAKLGYSRALYRIGSDYESRGDINTAVVYFEHGVKRGDAACYYRIAMAYLRGHLGKEVNTTLGLKYLEKSSLISDPDCPQSAYMYGLIQLGELPYVTVSNPQPQAGIMALERSAWLGFAPAQIRMGKSWQGGEKGYDAAVALRYFHLASRQLQYAKHKGDEVTIGDSEPGSAEAEISKWFLCGSEGTFVPNEEWAFKFAALAAEDSNPIAEFAVGYFYEVGIYVETNMASALEWYKLSAEHNCADAASRLKDLENTDGSVEVSRRLTRIDHERTLTVKGRGSIRSSRRVSNVNKPIPPVPAEEQEQELQPESKPKPEPEPELEREAPLEAPPAPTAPGSTTPLASTRNSINQTDLNHDDPKFDFESVKLPPVESSPFTVELGANSPQPSPRASSFQMASPQPEDSSNMQPLKIEKKRNEPRKPVPNSTDRRVSSFSVSLSDPPVRKSIASPPDSSPPPPPPPPKDTASQVTEKMKNLEVADLEVAESYSKAESINSPNRSPSIASSSWSSSSASSSVGDQDVPSRPQTAASNNSNHESEAQKSMPPPPQPTQAPPAPPLSSASSYQETPQTSTSTTPLSAATSWNNNNKSNSDGTRDDLPDIRQGPQVNRKSSPMIPVAADAMNNRPQSATVLPSSASIASSSNRSVSASRPASAFAGGATSSLTSSVTAPSISSASLPHPPRSPLSEAPASPTSSSVASGSQRSSTKSPVHSSSGSAVVASATQSTHSFDLKPPPSPRTVSSSRSSMLSLGKGMLPKSPSMLSLNSNKSSGSNGPAANVPKRREVDLKPTVPEGQTPMTFEEMGVPQASSKDKDCVIM